MREVNFAGGDVVFEIAEGLVVFYCEFHDHGIVFVNRGKCYRTCRACHIGADIVHYSSDMAVEGSAYSTVG